MFTLRVQTMRVVLEDFGITEDNRVELIKA